MIKVIFSCHVEPKRDNDDLAYLGDFFAILRQLDKPFVLTFMAGGRTGDGLLKYVKLHQIHLLPKCSTGLHVHDHETQKSIGLYRRLFGGSPGAITFGHWAYTNQDLSISSKNRVTYEMSYSGYRNNCRYFFKKQFSLQGLQEIPISCDPKYPINPLTTKYHFILSITLFILFCFSNKTLHLYFHSYDLEENTSAKWKLIFLLKLFDHKLSKVSAK